MPSCVERRRGGAAATERRPPFWQAVGYFEKVVELDSTFAEAWWELAATSAILYGNAAPSASVARKSLDAATRAAKLDPERASGHRALAVYYWAVAFDRDKALAEAEAAYRLAPSDASVLGTLAVVLASADRWEEALRYSKTAYTLDPRTASRPSQVAQLHLWLRRPDEARPLADRAMALAPRNVGAVETRVMVALSAGDLADARRVLRNATEIPPADLAAYMGTYWDLGWVLDDAGQRLLLSLGLDAFDDDPAAQAIVRAQLHWWRGDTALARAWGDSAARLFRVQVRDSPGDAQRHSLLGLALAYAGHRDEAIAQARRGAELGSVSVDAQFAPYFMHLLTRAYLLADRKDDAIDQLEAVIMKMPYYLTPAWLRIDPTFAPLRGDPRFQRLVGVGS